MKKPDVTRGAILSSDKKYRYRLWRAWGPGKRCVFIMLNPSTADADVDDPTIRRCMGFAQRWGYDGVEVINLFALRSVHPDNLSMSDDPVGPENDEYIKTTIRMYHPIICAWGNHGALNGRSEEVMNIFYTERGYTQALHITKKRQPGHPLYLPNEMKPESFKDLLAQFDIRQGARARK